MKLALIFFGHTSYWNICRYIFQPIGPWRWFDESMLDCYEPLEKVKSKGIFFGKLTCLAHCAGANVQAFRTNKSSIKELRNYVEKCSKSDECHVISHYHRGIFKQVLLLYIFHFFKWNDCYYVHKIRADD